MKRLLKQIFLFTTILSLFGCGAAENIAEGKENIENAIIVETMTEVADSEEKAETTATDEENAGTATDDERNKKTAVDDEKNVETVADGERNEETAADVDESAVLAADANGTSKMTTSDVGNPKEDADYGENTGLMADDSERSEGSTFEVHFIDVGQADAALVLCDEKAMLIDGGTAEDSSLIYTYLKDRGIDYLDYIVCTHAHEDHAGGLAGALNYASAGIALCPVTDYDSKDFQNFTTYLEKQELSITVPIAGDSFQLGSASIQILGPINLDAEDINNTSIVLRVIYGTTSFLFTGDAGREEEQDILNAGYELDSTVLKVGHHGSASSTTYPFLREIMPEYAVISVGKDNSYGHPAEETLSRLRDADVKVFRTDMQGDIICSSDGETVLFSVEKNADADTLSGINSNDAGENGTNASLLDEETIISSQEEETIASQQKEEAAPGIDYVLNTNTHKFHYPNCSSVDQMKESNKLFYTGTRDEVIAMGYDPCKRCKP